MKKVFFNQEYYSKIKRILTVSGLIVFFCLIFFTSTKIDEWLYAGVMLTGMMIFQVCKFFFYERKVDVSEILLFIISAGLLVYLITNFNTITDGRIAP
ncbi:hypothetical protein FZC84_01795 [Rossellomorea vietnamensis]|uniref:Uncharacterized protein n=1 Tax=Rossellomorea vietnamensis TaxID=218284 RepID=A0A5D4MK89_9BACI|nr:hypothetical protein [Rossellomorea vietnamensis]TYS01411.1 hypothetical protein FZC84_01795 [Rossellomorea vietnamensis]